MFISCDAYDGDAYDDDAEDDIGYEQTAYCRLPSDSTIPPEKNIPNTLNPRP